MLDLFRFIPAGEPGHPRGTCGGCGRFLWSDGGYRVPGIRGMYCGVECIETELFGGEHCRWCGEEVDKAYTSVDSRLCSEDCSENYYDHVLGDKTAALGTGRRFLLWLQDHQPELYRQVAGQTEPGDGYCQNPRCPNGEDGKPASLAHLRTGTCYCSDACKMQDRRSPNRQKSHSKTPVLRGFSSNAAQEMGNPVI